MGSPGGDMKGMNTDKADGGKMASLSDVSGEKDLARAGLIGINNLIYKLEPDMTVAVNCTDKNHFFQNQTYTNTQRAVCVLNSGADYIDPRRSSLNFTIELPNETAGLYGYQVVNTAGQAADPCPEIITFGKPIDSRYIAGTGQQHKEKFAGSAVNLIERITISTRSGDELSRIEHLNLLNYVMGPWTRDEAWNDTVGSAMGVNRYFTLDADRQKNENKGAHKMRVSIPLYVLSGLFNYDKLLPAMLMSGLRIEIQWASPSSAFVRDPSIGPLTSETITLTGTGLTTTEQHGLASMPTCFRNGGITRPAPEAALIDVFLPTTSGVLVNRLNAIASYSLTDIYFTLKSVQLTDSIQRILNETSAVNGLEIVYADINNSQQPQNATGDFYMEVRHAASRALRAIIVPRMQTQPDLQVCDSFATIGMPFVSWHWRLGSLYFPHQPIKGKTALENLVQTYVYTSDAMGKIAGGSRCAVKYEDYMTPYQRQCVNPVAMLTGGAFQYSPTDGVLSPVFPLTLEPNAIPPKFHLYDNFLTNAPIGVSLERSSLFNLSGIPINNSRVMSFHGTFDTREQEPKAPGYGMLIFDVFLQYVRLARVFLNNVEVEQ